MAAQQASTHVYDPAFFARMSDRESARRILQVLAELLRPASVLDVGCGNGRWLAEWASQGVTDVLGLDGEYVNPKSLQFDVSKFIPTDLQKPFSLGRKFGLVECLEVAEHIEATFADQLLESLMRHGDIILFSAAIPGQGGTNHVNEQWPSYWIEKFSNAGFKPYDVIRPLIWTDSRIEPWYRQNLLLFSKCRDFGTPVTNTAFDVVHPDLWTGRIDFARQPGVILRAAPGALKAAVKNKLPRWDARQIASEIAQRGSRPAAITGDGAPGAGAQRPGGPAGPAA